MTAAAERDRAARRGASSRAGMRRAARALAVQGLYEWLLSRNPPDDVVRNVEERLEEQVRAEVATLAAECLERYDAATLESLMRAEAAASVPAALEARARRFASGGKAPAGGKLDRAFVAELDEKIAERFAFARFDREWFPALFLAAVSAAPALETELASALDRKVEGLSPAERAILILGTHELMNQPEVPYRVAINEAVELAKVYGGTDGHRYVNGVLDKLAARLRPGERRS